MPERKLLNGLLPKLSGLCVTQFDSSLMERGLVASPGYLPTIFGAVVSVSRISYYKGDIASKSKFHISLGHETVMATITLLGRAQPVATCDQDSFRHCTFVHLQLFKKNTFN